LVNASGLNFILYQESLLTHLLIGGRNVLGIFHACICVDLFDYTSSVISVNSPCFQLTQQIQVGVDNVHVH